MHDLLHLLLVKEKVSLEELFQNAKNKLEIIAIFLAILELIKLKEVIAIQEELFGPILIIRAQNVPTYL
jgi:segregation and condensation protein A